MSNQRSCATCAFSTLTKKDDGLDGECRRRAPRPIHVDGREAFDLSTFTNWPTVCYLDWCGEWEPRQ